jgi:cobalt-zinc-cadmium efflux system protein
MGPGHQHGAAVSAGGAQRGRVLTVLAITAVVLAAEVVGGVITGSLALLADAGHMFTDVAGLGLAVLAVTFAAKGPTAQRTYGYYRLEILAAVVNGMLLFAIAAWILVEAWQRFTHPAKIEGGLMLVFAAVGLAANLVSMLLLRRGALASLNVKGAYLEVLGDLLGSVAVIAAAGIIPRLTRGELATPPARPIAGRPIMHEHRGQTSSRRIRARRRRLTLAWLAMLVLLAVAAAVVVIAAYRVRTGG